MKRSVPNRPLPRHARWLIHAAAGLSAAVLVVFHAVLFWQRIVDQSLFEPIPALRWLLTFALAGLVVQLHRRGLFCWRGRGALIFWVLVLLLHVSFWGPLAEPGSTSESWSGSGLMVALPAITLILGIVYPRIRRRLARLLETIEIHSLRSLDSATTFNWYLQRVDPLPVLGCRPPPAV